ncbi:hypothetical protein [Escherichia phage 4E8]|nr:hypothetical protein [Escherichia phage 4E8]
MSKVTYITVTDFLPSQNATESYTFPVENVTGAVEMIQFNQTSARTNVALRGADGKFISFRDSSVPKRIAKSIENLKPFPNFGA